MAGSTITAMALPIIAVRDLGAGAAQMGLLAATGTGAGMLLRLPAAVWADASSGPVTRIVARGQALGGLLVASVPVLWLLHALHFAVLVAVVAGVSGVAVTVEGFAAPILPRIVPRQQLPAANGRFMVSRSAAEVGGPGLGGVLVQLLAAPALLIIDACSYFAAAALTRSIAIAPEQDASGCGGEQRPPGTERPLSAKARAAGLVAVFADPFLRRCLSFIGAVSVANGIAQALLVILLLRKAGVTAGLVGLVLAVGAVGGVLGGAVIGPVRSRFGLHGTVGISCVLLVASLAGLPFAGRGWTGVAACVGYELAGSLGAVLMLVVVFSEIPGRLPGDRIARGLAMANLVPEACSTAGALAGGFLGAGFGVRTALTIAFCFALAAGAVAAGLALMPPRRKRAAS
jgi:predicted MFS family arabinose efflux permease